MMLSGSIGGRLDRSVRGQGDAEEAGSGRFIRPRNELRPALRKCLPCKLERIDVEAANADVPM